MFQVHLSKLGPLAKLLDQDTITLPDENPDAFNAIVNWIYNEPLPRAGRRSSYVEDAPRSRALSTTLSPDTSENDKGKSKAAEQDPAQPLLLPPGVHGTQSLLLDLMITAERHAWESLYNAAIDAFREGEANLARARPSTLHLEAAYNRTPGPGSTVRAFMADYAFALARARREFSWYLREGWFERIPEFLEDMLVRVDGKGPFRYPVLRRVREREGEVGGDDGDGEGGGDGGWEFLHREVPLDLQAVTYHVHEGRMVLDCECSEHGSCVVGC